MFAVKTQADLDGFTEFWAGLMAVTPLLIIFLGALTGLIFPSRPPDPETLRGLRDHWSR